MQSNIAIAQRGKGNDKKINAFGKISKFYADGRNLKIGKCPNDGLKFKKKSPVYSPLVDTL